MFLTESKLHDNRTGKVLKSFDVASRMIAHGGFNLDLILEMTGLKKATVNELNREMIENGEIEEEGSDMNSVEW